MRKIRSTLCFDLFPTGRKFVSILMRFWYLNGANLPDEVPGETKVFQIVFGDESTKEKRHLLTANYE